MLNGGFDPPRSRRPDRLGRRLRVLLYVAGLEPGGAEKRVERLARALDRSRFECIVAWRRPWGPVGDRLMEASVQVQRLALVSPSDRDKAVAQIGDLQPDVFHSFSNLASHAEVPAAAAAGVPIIITSRVGVRECDPHLRLQAWEQERNERTHWVTAVSEAAARLAIEVEGLPHQRVSVLHSGVEIPDEPSRRNDVLRRELGLDEHVCLVGYAGNYRPEKGHELLLNAFRRVRDRHPNAHLVCCGVDYEERRARLQSLAQGLGIAQCVTLLGTREHLDSFYRGLDLYVQPSLFEGFSNALLEAMSYSLPAIATAVGGNPEAIVNDMTGLLVAPNDPSALADGLMALLADAERRRAFGRAAGARCRDRFSVAAMVEAHERLYESLRPSSLLPKRQRGRARRVRILFHADYLWLGGLEKRVANLVLGIEQSCFEPIVSWSRKWGASGRRLAEAGVRVLRIDPRGEFEHTVAQIRDLELDILHSFSCTPTSDVVLAARAAGVPRIATSRTDVRYWDDAKVATPDEIERNDATDRIIACSQAVAATCMAAEGLPASKVTVVYSGVHLPDRASDITTLRDELGLDAGALLIGYAATYRSIKGHEVLLRAFREVVDRQACVHLVCCGEEHDGTKVRLRALVEELQLGQNVSLLPARSDIGAVYRSLDVYTHPSLSEGFSCSILEAMAHALPVVATCVGGVPEALIDGVTGILVPPADSSALATALLRPLNNPSLRRELGQAALDRIQKHFSIDAMVRGHEKVYLSMMSDAVPLA
jgi:glycosyltransferase involved in cell wall biosynthesis